MLSIQMFLQNKKWLIYGFSIALLGVACFLGVSIGSVSIPFSSIVKIFVAQFSPDVHLSKTLEMQQNIILQIRLPRVLLSMLVGASLALAGAGFQGLLKNPLADPYTLGISSGASLGAVFVLFFHIELPILNQFTLPVASIIGGFCTLLFVLFFAKLVDKKMSVETIILTGIIVSSFLGSVLSLMIALTGEELREIITWLLGSVSMRGMNYVTLILPFFVVGSLLILLNMKELNALAFGEETASQLGVDVQKRKMMLLIGASLLTGSAVAVSGTIGFVGLVIPHMTRLLFGADHKRLLPLSLINGGTFLIVADLIARTIIQPSELPIGVITSLVGAPMFAYIFFRQRKERK